MAGVRLLPRLVGPSRAMDLMFSARMVGGGEGERPGLVDRVLPAACLLAETRAYAVELATMVSPRSLKVMKRQLWDAQFQTLAEATAVGNSELMDRFRSTDFREGVAHFMAKQPPSFNGRCTRTRVSTKEQAPPYRRPFAFHYGK